MKLLAYLGSLWARLFRLDRVAGEMEEELRAHIALRADDLERSGRSRAEAERMARIEFGAFERYRQESHEAMGGNLLDVALQDLRFSLRVLRKSPGFVLAAVITLALAIGANAVVFGVMDSLVLRPLNVPQSENLWGTQYGNDIGFQSYPSYLDLRDRNRSFEDLAAFNFAFVGLDTGKEPLRAAGFATSGNYFQVLRVRPYLGRFYGRADEHGANSAPYLVLSYAFWHTHFQDDRGVVGRIVPINKHPFTVVGVAPPGFRGTILFISPDFFVPIVNQAQLDPANSLDDRGSARAVFEAFGHLKPGVTPAQALADVNSVAAHLAQIYPKQFGQSKAILGREGLTSFAGPVKAFMAGLMLLAALILLAACANLGGLFAARAADRSRELALRIALGSSRARILRQLLTEAVLVSIAGGIAGLAGSVALLRRLATWQPFSTAPIHLPVQPDWKVYCAAILLAVVSGLLFGIVPVRQVLRANPYEIVKAGSSSRTGSRVPVRDMLLVVQIAICAILVTSSMVAVRGLLRSLHGRFGFDPRAMMVSTDMAMAGYRGDQIPEMQKRILHTIESIPGVTAVGLVNDYPPLVYTAATRVNVYREEARDLSPANVAADPYRFEISPQYFQAAGTSLLAGRDFGWHDDKGSPAVGIVNREFATRMFGSITAALGREYKLRDGTLVRVVGVVEDGKYMHLTEKQEPAIFQPFLQAPTTQATMIVRSRRDPQQLAEAIRGRLRTLDAGMPVEIDSWSSMLDVVLFPSRTATMALGVLGLMGAMLSITGIFGMAAYSVSKRLKELGIRVALGAQRKELLSASLGRAFRLLSLGSAAGLLLGLLATRVLASIVYQATPRDPWVLGGVVVAMALLGMIATWLPARRALSVNPMILLRED